MRLLHGRGRADDGLPCPPRARARHGRARAARRLAHQLLGARSLSLDLLSTAWLAGALVIAAACFVQGLAGFGIGLVSLAFLPYLVSPAHAVVLITLFAAVFTVVIFIPLRGDFRRTTYGSPSRHSLGPLSRHQPG